MVVGVKQNCAPHTIFAPNTLSLPVGDIAANAARPKQVVGLYFFSPVEKIPLVEVIPHAATSGQTIATTVKLMKKQDEVPIAIRNKAGFYISCISAPCVNKTIRMLTEGKQVEIIGATLVKPGFPVRPIRLLGEVGTNMGAKVIPVLEVAYGEHFSASASVVASVLNDDRKGRENSRGFYLYDAKGRKNKKQVDPTVYTLIGIQGQDRFTVARTVERCVILTFNKAVRYFDERIVRSVRDDDISAVSGTGPPSLFGGLFRYMGSLGAGEVVAVLQRLTARYGSRFTPCE